MKNNDILLDVIGETDEEMIPELSEKQKRNTVIRRSVIGGGICAAVIIAAVLLLPESNVHRLPLDTLQEPSESIMPNTAESEAAIPSETDLESETAASTENEMHNGKLKLTSAIRSAGNGFEGVVAYDISELDTPNPWSAALEIAELPVYRNLSYCEEKPSLSGMFYLSEKQMEEIAQNTANALHIEITFTNMDDGGYLDGKIHRLDAKCENKADISVYGNGELYIDVPIQLPSGYSFTQYRTTAAEALKTLSYFSEEFSELLQYDDPVCYSYADRNYAGEENRSYCIYNRSDDPVQNILNFNLSYASFIPFNDLTIRITDISPSCEYLDDYPIITSDEAVALLLNGSYYSSVPTDYLRNGRISEEDIAKTELVYRNVKHEEYYQPYYRFYVELDFPLQPESPDGLKNFGIFYVPAVNAEYLNDLKVNITFN